MQQIFSGYPGQIWQSVYNALNYYYLQLSIGASPGTLYSMSQAMFDTMQNGIAAINAYDIGNAWGTIAVELQEIEALPISFTPSSLYALETRQVAYETAGPALLALAPQPPFLTPQQSIGSGAVMIPDPNLLNFYMDFSYETPPSGLTAANLITMASGVANNFGQIANAILSYQGVNGLTQLYDFATREQTAALAAYTILENITSSPISAALPVSGIWNTLVSLPGMSMSASPVVSAPFLYANQQSACIRYAMLSLAAQIGNFLVILRDTQSETINQTTLLQNESLMDVAARALGNFELWTEIATLNNLSPPYTGPTSASGVAAWGSQLILPGPNTQLSATGQSPDYETEFLGTDIYIGPINGVMPPWNGDFQMITGYNNLAWALGRRLQTTLGTLVYHKNYGSRIPPQVGAVQTSGTAGKIAAFGKSALLSDPRVAQVLQSFAVLESNFTVGYQGTVQPQGVGSVPTEINEVIAPI